MWQKHELINIHELEKVQDVDHIPQWTLWKALKLPIIIFSGFKVLELLFMNSV